MKNVKSVILAEAIKYFKSSTVSINRLLTKEHHKIVKQFMAYKERTTTALETAKRHTESM